MMSLSVYSRNRVRPGRALAVALLALTFAACEPAYDVPPEGPDEEAVELWSHPDTLGIEIYTPIELKARGKQIPQWQMDSLGLVGKLQPSPVKSDQPVATIQLRLKAGCSKKRSAQPGWSANSWPWPLSWKP